MNSPLIVFVSVSLCAVSHIPGQEIRPPQPPTHPPAAGALSDERRVELRKKVLVWLITENIRQNPTGALPQTLMIANHGLEQLPEATARHVLLLHSKLEDESNRLHLARAGIVDPSFQARAAAATSKALLKGLEQVATEIPNPESALVTKLFTIGVKLGGPKAVDSAFDYIHEHYVVPGARDQANKVAHALNDIPVEAYRNELENFATLATKNREAGLLAFTLGGLDPTKTIEESLRMNPSLRKRFDPKMLAALLAADQDKGSLGDKKLGEVIKLHTKSGLDHLASVSNDRNSTDAKAFESNELKLLEQTDRLNAYTSRLEWYGVAESGARLASALSPFISDPQTRTYIQKTASVLEAGVKLSKAIEGFKDLKGTASTLAGGFDCLSIGLSLASSLFGGGGDDGTSAILEQLGLLRQELRQVRDEMHKRFDHVDGKLMELSKLLDDGFGRMETLLTDVKMSVDDVDKHVTQLAKIVVQGRSENWLFASEILDALREAPIVHLKETTDVLTLPGQHSTNDVEKGLQQVVTFAKEWPSTKTFAPPALRDTNDSLVSKRLDNPLRYSNDVSAEISPHIQEWQRLPAFDFKTWAIAADAFHTIIQHHRDNLKGIDVSALAQQLLAPARQNLQRLQASLKATDKPRDPFFVALEQYQKAVVLLEGVINAERLKTAEGRPKKIDPWHSIEEALEAESKAETTDLLKDRRLRPHPEWGTFGTKLGNENWNKPDSWATLPAPDAFERQIDPVFRLAHRCGIAPLSCWHYVTNQLTGTGSKSNPLKIQRLNAFGASLGEITGKVVMVAGDLDSGQIAVAKDLNSGWPEAKRMEWKSTLSVGSFGLKADCLPRAELKTRKPELVTHLFGGIFKQVEELVPAKSLQSIVSPWLSCRTNYDSITTVQSLRSAFLASPLFKEGDLFSLDQSGLIRGGKKSAWIQFRASPLYSMNVTEWEAERNTQKERVAKWLQTKKGEFGKHCLGARVTDQTMMAAFQRLEKQRAVLFALLEIGYSQHVNETYAMRRLLYDDQNIASALEHDPTGDFLKSLIDSLKARATEAKEIVEKLRKDTPNGDLLDEIESLVSLVEATAQLEQNSP